MRLTISQLLNKLVSSQQGQKYGCQKWSCMVFVSKEWATPHACQCDYLWFLWYSKVEWEEEPFSFQPLFCGTCSQFGFRRQTLKLSLLHEFHLSRVICYNVTPAINEGPLYFVTKAEIPVKQFAKHEAFTANQWSIYQDGDSNGSTDLPSAPDKIYDLHLSNSETLWTVLLSDWKFPAL